MQLIYVVKKSQDICLLNSISPLIFGQPAEKCLLKVKVFVTQEEQSDATVRELVNEFSQVQTVNFGTKFLNFSISELENSLWMAAIAGISSILFLIFLIMFNHIFVPSQKNPTKEKTPSWVADLLIISSFILALICSIFVALVIRWRRLKKQIPPTLQKQSKALEKGSTQASDALEEHEIHFGGRPNFEGTWILFLSMKSFPSSKPLKIPCGSDIGVLVYGPESMKESVGHQFARKNVELRSRNPISASTPSISHSSLTPETIIKSEDNNSLCLSRLISSCNCFLGFQDNEFEQCTYIYIYIYIYMDHHLSPISHCKWNHMLLKCCCTLLQRDDKRKSGGVKKGTSTAERIYLLNILYLNSIAVRLYYLFIKKKGQKWLYELYISLPAWLGSLNDFPSRSSSSRPKKRWAIPHLSSHGVSQEINKKRQKNLSLVPVEPKAVDSGWWDSFFNPRFFFSLSSVSNYSASSFLALGGSRRVLFFFFTNFS
ncbi:unnamed protein product [Prunus brigantina]